MEPIRNYSSLGSYSARANRGSRLGGATRFFGGLPRERDVARVGLVGERWEPAQPAAGEKLLFHREGQRQRRNQRLWYLARQARDGRRRKVIREEHHQQVPSHHSRRPA